MLAIFKYPTLDGTGARLVILTTGEDCVRASARERGTPPRVSLLIDSITDTSGANLISYSITDTLVRTSFRTSLGFPL